MPYAHITGWGMAVPERVITNADLEKLVNTTDQWIVDRTGIKERHIVREGQSTATLAVEASWKALAVANLKPVDIDLIICATSTPEFIFPATACIVQDKLGAKNAGAFDLSAACTGFIYALNLAAQSIISGSMKNVLIIGSETLSKFVNWNDRNTCILFGDGSGALVLQASEQPGGVMASVLHSDGSGGEFLSLPAGGSRNPASEATIRQGQHFIHMNGKEVFRFATRVMAQATRDVLEKADILLEDVSWIIPHQANQRIIDAAARGLKLPIERFVVNLDKYGNTSTASIPIALCEAVEDGRLKNGDKFVFVGFGAGLTWGASVAQWTESIEEMHPIKPGYFRLFARIRSFLRRIWLRIEGLIWGK
ncbi:MAG: beta-ketoacyl-ACP synthase III [Anaerolineales bacterium]|jgi:3-oxoacyl-[acyl-carrier-protein] synthase-3